MAYPVWTGQGELISESNDVVSIMNEKPRLLRLH